MKLLLLLSIIGVSYGYQNVAFMKPATMSSYHKLFGTPEKAVDGLKETKINHCTHTDVPDNNTYRWFRVDLGRLWAVRGFYILNRGDCCANKLANFTVDVARSLTYPSGIHQATSVSCYSQTAAVGESIKKDCVRPIVGRYVTIILHSSVNPLHICEFEVYASEVTDPCLQKPCQNEGTCNLVVNGLHLSFNCTCPPGYTGPTCSQGVDACVSEPCKHGGVCTNVGDSFSCACRGGYQGPTCKDRSYTPRCYSFPCLNGGECTEKDKGYECKCPEGYKGRNCERAPQPLPCASNPCKNGAECVDKKRQTPNYKCKCTGGYKGTNCEISKTGPFTCDFSPCLNGATCVNKLGKVPNYKCKCLEEFRGVNCEEFRKTRPCGSHPCKNGATCKHTKNKESEYKCLCAVGYTGTLCDIPNIQ